MVRRDRYDVVVVGGGHNGLVAAGYLARAGRRVLVLERREEFGGAAVSARPFDGVDVRLSRYSYLVSLLPSKIVKDLGLTVRLHRRRVSSYTPSGGTGLLVDGADPERTRASFASAVGSATEFDAWRRFYAMAGRVAERVAGTLLEPLPSRAELRARVADEPAWRALFERPLAETLEREFRSDLVRGVVLTDGLIGTFARADEPSLRQNRCLLYHVVGNGTGEWNVPVGGMGALSARLRDTALRAGARLLAGAEALSLDPDGEVSYRFGDTEHRVHGRWVLVNAAPETRARLMGEPVPPRPEGAQLKVNMVLSRLPRPRDPAVSARDAFAGTFHVNEGYRQLAEAYTSAERGRWPSPAPCEVYCHTLSDPSILGERERAAGVHTLTLFGLHMPARLFAEHPERARAEALAASLASLNQVLAEPIEDCLLADAAGRPCVEARSPLDLERELGMPGGHIFHRDLSWPYAADTEDSADAEWVGRWGVGTAHPRVLMCGAGAVRGGGVSGIPGHNAAMAVLDGA